MWWYLYDNGVSWFWLNDLTEREASSISGKVVVLSEFVDTKDLENTSISNKLLVWVDLIAC